MYDLLAGAVILSGVYALVAFAWVLLNRTNAIPNLALGAQLAAGAFIYNHLATNWQWPWWLTVLGMLASLVVISWVMHYVIFGRMVGQPIFTLVIATLALASIMRGIISLLWGTEARVMREPIANRVVELPLGISATNYALFGLLFTVVILIGSAAFFRWSTTGIQMRAAAENPVLAAQSRIPVDRVYVIGWFISLIIAALAGIFYSYLNVLSYEAVDSIGLRGIAPALVGGLTSVAGVVPGALIVAIGETFGVHFFGGSAQDVAGWLIVLIVLMVRPTGLFGERRIERA